MTQLAMTVFMFVMIRTVWFKWWNSVDMAVVMAGEDNAPFTDASQVEMTHYATAL